MSLVETSVRPAATPPVEDARVELIEELKRAGYNFVTPSVATHRTVFRRSDGDARGLRDVFGWSLPFQPHVLSPRLLEILTRGELMRSAGDRLMSTVRVSSLGDDLLLHSAFPTQAPDSVFFGPDTYRFASFLRGELESAPSYGVVVDIGAGSGAGAITAARDGEPDRLVLADINPRALDFAAANLRAADLEGEVLLSRGLDAFQGTADLIVANPPFIAGGRGHAYRDGGDFHGAALSLAWAEAAGARLNPGGRLLLYTGSAIVDGQDLFLAEIRARLAGHPVRLEYRELDPDIFGGMLTAPEYADVERIAAVGLVVTRDGPARPRS